MTLMRKGLLLACLPLLFTVASCGGNDDVAATRNDDVAAPRNDDVAATKGYSYDIPKELEPFIEDIEFIDKPRRDGQAQCLVMWLYFEINKLNSDYWKNRLNVYCEYGQKIGRLDQLLRP